MTRFEPRTSGIRSDRSANWATTTTILFATAAYLSRKKWKLNFESKLFSNEPEVIQLFRASFVVRLKWCYCLLGERNIRTCCLNGRNVMVHWYSCRCSYPSPPPSSGVHVSSPHMNVHDKTCRFINTASFIRLRTWAVMNWRCGGSFVKKYIHIVSWFQVYILQN